MLRCANTNGEVKMAREYKTVRLAYEAKVWVNELIIKRNSELQSEMKNGLIEKLENQMFALNPHVLDGISFNVVLKVSVGSVLEQAVRATREYDKQRWYEIAKQMEEEKKKIQNVDVADITPRIYVSSEIWDQLECLRYLLRGEGASLPRLSYIIKLVIYAGYSLSL